MFVTAPDATPSSCVRVQSKHRYFQKTLKLLEVFGPVRAFNNSQLRETVGLPDEMNSSLIVVPGNDCRQI
jgi:hypothetical protein